LSLIINNAPIIFTVSLFHNAWREPCYVVATALYGSGIRDSEVGINILVYTRSPGTQVDYEGGGGQQRYLVVQG